jgi:hypothetical protein
VKPKHLVGLSQAFGLDAPVVTAALEALDRHRKAAEKAVIEAATRIGEQALGHKLLGLMERRWNGSFKSIGRFLSKKRSGAGGK